VCGAVVERGRRAKGEGRRHGSNISGHNEVPADESGDNGRTIRPSEKQSAGKIDTNRWGAAE